MLSRKEQNDSPKFLPQAWSIEVEGLLSNIYADQLNKLNKKFDVHGATFPDEVIIFVTLLDKKNEIIIPVTYALSADLTKKNDPSKFLGKMVDSIGLFFDTYFVDPDSIEYQNRWQEIEYEGQDFFYQINRENVTLTIAADAILGE